MKQVSWSEDGTRNSVSRNTVPQLRRTRCGVSQRVGTHIVIGAGILHDALGHDHAAPQDIETFRIRPNLRAPVAGHMRPLSTMQDAAAEPREAGVGHNRERGSNSAPLPAIATGATQIAGDLDCDFH